MRDDNRYVYRLIRVCSHQNEPVGETVKSYPLPWQALKDKAEAEKHDDFSLYYVDVDYD